MQSGLPYSNDAPGMESLQKSVEIEVPVETAYLQWKHMEELPKFVPGVMAVEPLDENRFRWCTAFWGSDIEWEAEIFEDVPNDHISWRSLEGIRNSGVAIFERLSEQRTRVTLRMCYEPVGLLGQLSERLGLVESTVERHLRSFRDYLEGKAALERMSLA